MILSNVYYCIQGLYLGPVVFALILPVFQQHVAIERNDFYNVGSEVSSRLYRQWEFIAYIVNILQYGKISGLV